MEETKCSVCQEQTTNHDLNPLSGTHEYICENCLEQFYEQIDEVVLEEE